MRWDARLAAEKGAVKAVVKVALSGLKSESK